MKFNTWKFFFPTTLMLVTLPAHANGYWTEVQSQKTGSTMSMSVSGGVRGAGWSLIGMTTSGRYSQMYAGPTFATKSVGGGMGVGAEWLKGRLGHRIGAHAWLSHGDASFLALYENGGVTGPWRREILKYQFSPQASVGVQHETYVGTGIRTEYRREGFIMWSMVSRRGAGTIQLGIKSIF